MNKGVSIFVILLLPVVSIGQVLNVGSNFLADVYNYSGATSTDAFILRIGGSGNLNMSNWRMSVSLEGPLTTTVAGKTYIFPTDKLSFQPTATSGYLNPGPVPTIGQIAPPMNVTLTSNPANENFLIPNSQAALVNQGLTASYEVNIHYNLTIAGGAYLADFQTNNGQNVEFRPSFLFRFYDRATGQPISTVRRGYNLIIHPFTDPMPAELSLQVAANATNALLQLTDKSDYNSGAKAEYSNGLLVKANTGYQITVKALTPSFNATSGNTLSLNAVQLSLTPVSANNINIFPVQLSTSPQAIARSSNGTNNTTQNFNIKYATKPNDPLLMQARSDHYTTTLQYEIIPL